MKSMTLISRFTAPAVVRPEALNVTPDLLGMPLAPPSRRLMAIAVDGLVVSLMSSISGLWLIFAAALVGKRLSRDGTHQSKRRIFFFSLAILVLLWIGGQQAWTHISQNPAIEALSADDEDDKPKAKLATDAERIADLEKQLEIARKPKEGGLIASVKQFIRARGVNFGWAIVYFAVVPYFWKGQTVGKRVFGLRVVELTGKPMTIMHCVSRYGGYAAGMATGLLGFAQVLWDDNRQAIQDKIAHTVVIDVRHVPVAKVGLIDLA